MNFWSAYQKKGLIPFNHSENSVYINREFWAIEQLNYLVG